LGNTRGRLLGRNGAPLAIPVTVDEIERDGRRLLATELLLAPLAAGDYIVEVTADAGGQTGTNLYAFRVR
jgi:hypothetical protein